MTLDQLLSPTRIQHKKRGKTTTKPGTLLQRQISIKTNQWDESRPGFLEADTVAHWGKSFSGIFAYTIDCVDIAIDWTEQRPVWGKGETEVLKQIKQIEKGLPFPLLGFDYDNGAEFLIITSSDIIPKEDSPSTLLAAEPITKMTMPMSNRKTGPTSDNGLVTAQY